MTQRCHLEDTLFRACKNDFQLPQATAAFGGNWLIPKRKILRVIRCLKAGDFCAFQLRLISLTLPHKIRNRMAGRVSHYAIGIRCVKATWRTFCHQSATLCGKPDLLSSSPPHPASPSQIQNRQRSRRRTSLSEEGKKGNLWQKLYPSSNTNVACAHIYVVRASRLFDGLKLSGANHSSLPAVIDSR